MKLSKMVWVLLAFVLLLPAAAFADLDSITKFGSDIYLAKDTVVAKAVAVGGDVTVAGKVEGDVAAIGGNVILEDSATVLGNVVTVGGAIAKAPKAVIKGEIIEIGVPANEVIATSLQRGEIPLLGLSLVFLQLLIFLAVLILALVTVAYCTKQVGVTSFACEKKFWRCFWVGLLELILLIPITLLLVVSIVGLAFLPLWIILVIAALFFAKVAVSQLIGKLLLAFFKVTRKPMLLEVTLGLVILALLSMIPVLGWLVKAVLVLAALGAVTLTRFGTQKA
jgi:hypothetical protein